MTGSCSLRRVRSANQAGDRLVGDLYLPAATAGDLPALAVTGSWTTVKEQMASLYAQRLAQRGFAALAFDFAALPEGTAAFAAGVAGLGRLSWHEGQQLDVYDQPAQVDFAVSAMADHFAETLQPDKEAADV